MRTVSSLFAALALVVSATCSMAACSKASEEADSKRAPETPPPPGPGRVPESWHVEVLLDGAEVPSLTAATLDRIKPDFADSERLGWRVETLLPGAADATLVIADGATGLSVLYEVPSVERGDAASPLRPALFLTRRGELIAASVDPANPFPRYHGKGGQLRRIGDSQPRLLGVKRLRIYHGKIL